MLFAGLDTHKESVLLHMIDGRGRMVREERFPTDDMSLLRLAKIVGKAQCVMEAGSTCYPVYDALTERGIKVKVAHPLLLKSLSGLKKTDKIDARRIARMLKAGIIPEAYIPTKNMRMERDLVNQHIFLVRQRTREINRVRALLLRYRIKPKAKSLFGTRANWLDEAEIPVTIKPLLQQSIEQIRRLREQQKQVDALIEEQARNNEDAVLLHTIPGVGWFTSYLVSVTVDGVGRFGTAEQLVSYAGLAPRVYQSGDTKYSGSISKTGRSELRWALGQCAWIAVGKSRKFRKKYLKLKRKHKEKKAITAVARKLLVVMYYMLKRREVFDENA